MRLCRWLFLLTLALATGTAAAQERSPWTRSIAAGWTRELAGDLESSRPGGHAELMLARSADRFGVRVELMYHRLAAPGATTCLDDGCRERKAGYTVTALAASATADLTHGRAPLYVVGGTGLYHYDGVRRETVDVCSVDPCALDLLPGARPSSVIAHSAVQLGASGGVGMRYEGRPLTLFLEARYHRLLGGGPDRAMLPLSVGISF